MKNSTKGMVALALAMAVTLLGISYSTAEAASETKKWTATDVNYPGAPSSETKTGKVTMHASSEKYTGTVTSISDITNRKLTLSCTSHTMYQGNTMRSSLEYNNIGPQSWKIKGSIKDVSYKMVAYTSLKTALSVSGNIKR